MSLSAFKGFDEAKVSQRNPNFPAGENFLVEVEACKLVTNHQGQDFFVIEAEVLESSTNAMKPGTVGAQVIGIPGKYRMGFSNVKAFLAAANGIDPSNNDAVEAALGGEQGMQVAAFAVSDDNPLAGVKLRLRTSLTQTKAGNDFTIHSWSPAEEG